MKVLIVEDHPLLLRSLADTVLVAQPAATVLRAQSIEEADLQIESSGVPDIILLDLGLQDAEGLEGLVHFRAIVPSASIAVMSGSTSSDLGRDALAHGAAAYLEKGSDVDAFVAALRSLLGLRQCLAGT